MIIQSIFGAWKETWMRWIFFFQAEDGIRDYKVTGVQTCALPILGVLRGDDGRALPARHHGREGGRDEALLQLPRHLRARGHGHRRVRDLPVAISAAKDRKSVV